MRVQRRVCNLSHCGADANHRYQTDPRLRGVRPTRIFMALIDRFLRYSTYIRIMGIGLSVSLLASPVRAESRTEVASVLDRSTVAPSLFGLKRPALSASMTNLVVNRSNRRPRKGMMIAGWTILGASYLIAFTIGWTAYDSASFWAKSRYGIDNPLFPNELKRIENYGKFMMIPAIGPFLASGHARLGIGRVFTGFLGTVEVAGLVLGILGIVRYNRMKAAQPYPQVRLQYGRGYSGASLGWQF